MKQVKTPILMAAVTGLALGLSTPAAAQQVARASDASVIASGRMATLDLAGVRLGMTPAEVQASLNRAGYKINHRRAGPSYQQLVQAALRARVPATPYVPSSAERTPREWSLQGPHREFLLINFAPMPGGPRVHTAAMSFNSENSTIATIAHQVAEKFGAPSVDQPLQSRRFWCGDGDRTCGDIVSYQAPFLMFGYFANNGSLRLTAAEPVKRWLDRAVASQVDRQAPQGRSTF